MADDKKAAKSKYIAETRVNHDGRDYDVGDEIELTADQAKALGRDVSEPGQATQAATDAPKQRKKEADEREAASTRREYDAARNDYESAKADEKAARAKAEDAKKRVDAARTRLQKMKQPLGEGPHTWEQDADALGGGQLSAVDGPGAGGKPAEAPASGKAMTPSTPTAEAVQK
jgi:chromosome segregation ATPase